jgi:3-hydroxy acid dehydrogenase / malonic semialdehyde reductase
MAFAHSDARDLVFVQAILLKSSLLLRFFYSMNWNDEVGMSEKKWALVSGASAGIGREICLTLAKEGWSIVAFARRQDRLEALCEQVMATGVSCRICSVDIQDRAAILNEMEQADFPDIDLLVNNAGLALGVEPLQQGNPDDWEIVLQTNIHALLFLSRQVMPGMVERGRGQIVNIGSIAGRQTYPGGAVYCASKAAELALSRGMGIDLVGTPVRVCSIDPGLVETEFSNVRFRGDDARATSVYSDIDALQPRDVAEAVRWVVAQPKHVQVSEIVLFPTCQAAATVVHRGELGA